MFIGSFLGCLEHVLSWETLATINFTKELPQNTTVIQSELTEKY